MHSLAWSPVHRFPRKLTSKDTRVPAALNLLIISMVVSRISPFKARVMPVVWKHLEAVYTSSGISSISREKKELWLRS